MGFPAPAGMDPRPGRSPRNPCRLPRARGDGPHRHARAAASRSASPRPRGWTRDDLALIRLGGGFPAPAGMDPDVDRATATGRRLPRARGDGPLRHNCPRRLSSASPRPRGWTVQVARLEARLNGFPAPAGMDPSVLGLPTTGTRLPRARGDGPARGIQGTVEATASPRPRGWTRGCGAMRGPRPGFPAPAGMDPLMVATKDAPSRLPRARGDGPRAVQVSGGDTAASPRPRGWTLPEVEGRASDAGFPAPAGMDPRRASQRHARARLPRARGDGPCSTPTGWRSRPASPRPRGWTRAGGRGPDHRAGFPAPAGMDPPCPARRRQGRRLPRARGDGPSECRPAPVHQSASPRPRGWTLHLMSPRHRCGGFPAPAGMDPGRGRRYPAPARLPRARGDGPRTTCRSSSKTTASPRPRGWTRLDLEHVAVAAGFPAPAGMDPRRR